MYYELMLIKYLSTEIYWARLMPGTDLGTWGIALNKRQGSWPQGTTPVNYLLKLDVKANNLDHF